MVEEKDEKDIKQILAFALGESLFALYLSAVERVVRAVETTPLPKAPQFVVGVINIQGQVIPVVDIRSYFDLAAPEINQNNRFILVRTARRLLALVVDSVTGILELTTREFVNASQVLPCALLVHGLAKVDGELVLICDLDQFLSLDNEKKLEAALKGTSKTVRRRSRSQSVEPL